MKNIHEGKNILIMQLEELDQLLQSKPSNLLGSKHASEFINKIEENIQDRIECGELCEECYLNHNKQVETERFADEFHNGVPAVIECTECGYTIEEDVDLTWELVNSNEIY